MTNGERAEQIFKEGFNCAQAILTTYCEKYGMNVDEASKISCGFGAGCGRQSLTCGAVSGAFLVIGLKYGNAFKLDKDSKEVTYEKIKLFIDRFKKMYGSVNCYELLGCDLDSEEGQSYYKDYNMFENECCSYVKNTCKILDEMGL